MHVIQRTELLEVMSSTQCDSTWMTWSYHKFLWLLNPSCCHKTALFMMHPRGSHYNVYNKNLPDENPCTLTCENTWTRRPASQLLFKATDKSMWSLRFSPSCRHRLHKRIFPNIQIFSPEQHAIQAVVCSRVCSS